MPNDSSDGFDFDGLDFGDIDLDSDSGTDNTDNQSDQNQADEYGDFSDNSNNNEMTADKSSIIKTAAIMIAVGIMIVIIAFKVVGSLTSAKDDDKVIDGNTSSQISNQPQVQIPQNSTQTDNLDGWSKISGEDNINFSDNLINTSFTITQINHYAKIVSDNIVMKTVLKGIVNGYDGTYELEVPYSKGCQLKTGMEFKIQVEVGEFNGKTVIGDISY